MINYISKSGNQSGVTGYQPAPDYILIQFNHAVVYKYSHRSCGIDTTETLKNLAAASRGLGTFIARHQPAYEWKK